MTKPMMARTAREMDGDWWLVTALGAALLLAATGAAGAESDKDAMLRVGSAGLVDGASFGLSEDISLGSLILDFYLVLVS